MFFIYSPLACCVVLLVGYLAKLLFRAFSTLWLLRSNGIEIFKPSTFVSLLFSADSRGLYDALMAAFQKGSKSGLYGWLTPVGKSFLVITDSRVLAQVIVENQPKLTKHHAFGILELFRKTDLEAGPAWKVVHRIASKFPVTDQHFQIVISKMISKFADNFAALSADQETCFAVFTRDFYWEVVLVMVIGDSLAAEEMSSLKALYKDAWTACIAALGQPGAHMLRLYTLLPLPAMLSYRRLTNSLRQKIKCLINSKSSRPSWCILSVIENEMGADDQLEVAMEFLFTGASSVTTSLVWMVWHIALDTQLQALLRQEAKAAGELSRSDGFPENWVAADAISGPLIDAALRETLRMYPPIHIGRLSLEEFTISNALGDKVTISAGTDIMCNAWFIHRDERLWTDPHTFDHSRFLDKPYNVPNFHPFSMGVRSCPGQRIAYNILKLVVSNILVKYEIDPLVGVRDVRFAPNLMLPVTPENVIVRFKLLENLLSS